MPKIVTKGVGLMQRKVETINLEEEPEAFMPGGVLEKWVSEQRTPDGCRDENANHCRAVLTKAYAKMDPARFCRDAPSQVEAFRAEMGRRPRAFVASYFGEDHAYAIMQQWLDEYDRLAGLRAKPDPDIARIVQCGEELGKLYERLYWRAGVDPDTRVRREALALQGKGSRKGSRRGHEATHGTEDEKQERWRWMAAAFEEEYAKLGRGRRKVASYDIVAERFGVNRSTVIRALNKYL